ncbi:hypothetical protein SCHPADRAFT_937561 [Schizopora paradoxa]|uniref:Uncharacterized protein n=1 Tax=Schizopora paradoxa TaxID=27342 RepID=A0A0H2RYM0_9AGAM|nr:hypothetical protein SCHPADRAFT_937561 [Schizopora paradoxa]
MAGEDGKLLSPPVTPATRAQFRESIAQIPTPSGRRPKAYEPPQLQLWLFLSASMFMIILAIALEVALSISQRHNGFSVPQKNAFKFASQQFLTSFVPICFVVPLVWLWESKTWLVKRYQPYINLSRGNTTAEDSILLDYISLNTIYAVYLSFMKKHWLVFFSAVAGLTTAALQPLAGSIFDVTQVPVNTTTSVISNRTLGLDPNRATLSNFVASAGYVQAAVSNNLPDPPFVHGPWAAADFTIINGDYLNGTVAAQTIGIRQNATCSAPTNVTLDTTSAAPNFTITGTSAQNCKLTFPFNPQNAAQQYGVQAVANCGRNGNVTQAFQPVFFWFFHTNTAGTPQANGVFCEPTLEVFNIIGNASIVSNALGNVTIISNITSQNNVTGAPLNGIPYNAVVFDPSPDEFTAARATATNNGVPGAILSSFVRQNDLQSGFDTPDGFLNETTQIYTQHLALVAKNTYMISVAQTIPSITESLRPRLVLEPLASHALAVVLFIIGLIMLFVGVQHRRERKGVFLASAPGSIASATCLTSHSGFGELLNPYDTDFEVALKMGQLLFCLDERTGAITAVDRPGASFLGRGYRDDTVEKDDKLDADTSGLSRGVSVGSSGERHLDSSGYILEPYSPPAERQQGGAPPPA